MKKQRGVSLTGLLISAVLLIVVCLVGFKLAPSYMEYFTVKKVLKEIALNPEAKSGNAKDVQLAFSKYQMVEGIKVIEPADVVISKEGSEVTLSASWTVKIPFVSNISVVIDFEATSAGK